MYPNLERGLDHPMVGNWQRFLNRVIGARLSTDERFGALTAAATASYQRDNGLRPDGIVGPLTRERASLSGFVPFLQAKNRFARWPQHKTRPIRHVVIHTMETRELMSAAEDVARWFADQLPAYPAPRASAHYCLDPDSTVQTVRDVDVAWGVPGKYADGVYVNDETLHVEHAGFARQSAVEWDDGPSRLILFRSARLVARLCSEHGVPVRRVDAEGLKAGERGVAGHVDFSAAFPTGKDPHWDPGPNFPWQRYLEQVENAS